MRLATGWTTGVRIRAETLGLLVSMTRQVLRPIHLLSQSYHYLLPGLVDPVRFLAGTGGLFATIPGADQTSCPQGAGMLSLERKLLELEPDDSPPSNASIKMHGALPVVPLTCSWRGT
jgi:hypothetical protein